MGNYGGFLYGGTLYGGTQSYPSYGPYGSSVGMPEVVGGIDDGRSLMLLGIVQSGNYWYPKLLAGRYIVSGENSFRYLYNAPETVTIPIVTGEATYNVPLPSSMLGPDTFGLSPVTIVLSSINYSQVVNTVRWCLPVPSGATVIASSIIDPRYITSGSVQSQTVGTLPPNAILWYMPTYGGRVIAVHRSRNPRSYDVLADGDALLREVDYPDQLTNDRVYCHDEQSGWVYGLISSENLPPPPYSTGGPAQTYVSLAIPTDASTLFYWTASGTAAYRSNMQSFFDSFEGATGMATYDPLRCEEISYVDIDGYIRLRHSNVATSSPYKPSVLYIAPDGWKNCITSTVSGNVIDALMPDPTTNNTLSRLPYGATVLARYYVNNSFCFNYFNTASGAATGSVSILSTASGSATMTYETSLSGPNYPTNAPNLNPLTNQISSGFLYLQDANNPSSIPSSMSGQLSFSTTRPVFDLDFGEGEVITVKAIAYDGDGIPIVGVPLSISLSSSNYNVISTSPNTAVSAADGTVLFYLRATSSSASTVTVTLIDSRVPSMVLATGILEPSLIGGAVPNPPAISSQPWEPSVFVSLGETYRYIGNSLNGTTRQMIRVFAIQPDGFPWLSIEVPGGDLSNLQSSILVLTSTQSIFHDPTTGTDVSLGAQIQVSLGDSTPLLSSAGVLTVGYDPVPGDIITATLYSGDFKYESFPVVVS